ncbi:MAG: beta-glucosidase [Pseudomonadota bacterium]|nr:beta-glucosidase [Pseudomonadota bacterium]
MAGFECSSHRRKDGVRLDLIRATAHDLHARDDYRRCAELGLATIRDGLRWHLIETAPRSYDWSSWVAMIEAAAEAGVQVVWDMFHYGSPDHLGQTSPDFPEAFARFAAEAVRIHREVAGEAPLICPVNEISFFAWAVETGYFPPRGVRKGGWFKRQLVRCAIAGVEAMRAAEPGCRFVWAEPLIHVAPRDRSRAEAKRAEAYRVAQFEAYDLLVGRTEPELGGRPEMIDVLGLNFYPHNQWYYRGPTIPMGHHEYRPLADMLVEVAERFGKPIFLAETGAEGSGRPAWLHYVCDEVRDAIGRGAPFHGICLYPVTSYPGWDNSRHAEVGLFSTPLANGERRLFEPLAAELERQRLLFG